MTLISITQNRIQKTISPIIIGDILVSSIEPNPTYKLPTFLEGIGETGHLNQPIELKQKIYIINENVVIALSGSVYLMKKILEDVRSFFKWRNATEDNLVNLSKELQQYDLDSTSTSYIIVLRDSLNIIKLIGEGSWHTINTIRYGEIKANGSGAKDFFKFFISEKNKTTKDDESTPFYSILCNHIILMAKLIAQEKESMITLKKGWGAAYELICSQNGKFVKVNNITNILINANININTDFIDLEPLSLYNNQYYLDILNIMVYDFKSKKNESFIVEPLDNALHSTIKKKWHEIEFDINFICLTFLFKYSTGETIYFSMIPTPSPNVPFPIDMRINTENNSLHLGFHKQFINQIYQIGKNYFNEKPLGFN